MSVTPALAIPASTDTPVELGQVRANAPVPLLPGSGQDSYGKVADQQGSPATPVDPQDEVKVQFEPPGEVAVYQFVTQDGSLIVQVPSEQMLTIAREISQSLAQESATKSQP
jgi:hypothetical protein